MVTWKKLANLDRGKKAHFKNLLTRKTIEK